MKKIFLFIFMLFFLNGFSQSNPKDLGLWTTFSIDKKVTKRWSIGFDQEFRMFDNISRINLFYTNLGVNYKLKSFKFALVYRFISKNEDDLYYSKGHRMYFDASYKYKIKDLTLSYRLRTQAQYSQYYSSEQGKNLESVFRHKFEADYGINKFTPYVSGEFQYQLNKPSYKEGNNLFNRMRYIAGCNYDFNRVHSVGLYYLFQHDFNGKNNGDDYVIGIQYGINL